MADKKEFMPKPYVKVMNLTYPEPQYEDRLMCRAKFIVVTSKNQADVSRALTDIKNTYGEIEATDLLKCCEIWWRSLKT